MASDVYQKLLKFVTFVKVPHLQKSASPLLAVPFLLDLTWDHCRFGMAQGLSRYVGMPPKLLFHWENDRKMMIKLSKLGSNPIFSLKQSPSETQDVLIQAKRAWQRITDEALQCIQCQFQCHLLGPRWGLRWLSVSSAQALGGSSPEPDRLKHGWKQPSRKLLCTSLHVRAFFGTGLAPVVCPSFAGPPRCEMLAVAKCWRSVFSGH